MYCQLNGTLEKHTIYEIIFNKNLIKFAQFSFSLTREEVSSFSQHEQPVTRPNNANVDTGATMRTDLISCRIKQ